MPLTYHREVIKGQDFFQVADQSTDASGGRELVPAKAGFFGHLKDLTVSLGAAGDFSVVYGTTAIIGPFYLPAKTPVTFTNIVCPVAGITINYSTTAGNTIALHGHGQWEQDTELNGTRNSYYYQ